MKSVGHPYLEIKVMEKARQRLRNIVTLDEFKNIGMTIKLSSVSPPPPI